MNIVGAVLAEGAPLPPITALGYEYVVAANGLFIRAEDSRLEALLPVAGVDWPLRGLESVTPYARLKLPRVPVRWLWAVWQDARRQIEREVLYQFIYDADWRCMTPHQTGTATTLDFSDDGQAIVDLHSHPTMDAFFSDTDDADENGLRFYAVIGRLDTGRPEIAARVGVYGHLWKVPASVVFDALGPFTQVSETHDPD